MKSAAFAVLLMLLLAAPFAAYVHASTPTFSLSAKTDKTAYYVGEPVQVTATLSWSGLTQNYTVDVQLWNSTSMVEALATGVAVPGAAQANGTLTATYTVTDVTGASGLQTYSVRMVDESSGLTVASANIQFTVQSQSIVMSVSWDDANGDRHIDTAETVTFNVYLTWAFVNDSVAATLKVNDNGLQKVVDAVSISAGSGTAQKTYVTSFDTVGAKTLTFTLEGANGNVLASKQVTVVVGNENAANTGNANVNTTQTASTADVFGVIYEMRYYILVLLAVIVLALILRKH